jgi:hypothetical protein
LNGAIEKTKHRRSSIQEEGIMSKRKANAASFKKGRKKIGGRKAGTPNKTTWVLREVVLAAAEAAGNKLGRNGHLGYMTWVALNYPPHFLRVYADSMPRQLEPEQTAPFEGREVIHTMEELREELMLRGVPPAALARVLVQGDDPLDSQEHSGTAGPTSSADDHCVEDDTSNDSPGEG